MAKIKAKQIDTEGLSLAVFPPTRVLAGQPIVVPTDRQLIIMVSEFLVDDELTLNGDLVLL